MTATPGELSPGRLAAVSFFVSAGLLGFEIALLRVLLLASWHHFAFLIISAALLGFGASGTALVLLRGVLLKRGPMALLLLCLAAAVSMPVCLAASQLIETDARLAPALLGRQLGRWLLYWAVLGAPFLVGAAAGGLALMLAGPAVPAVYAGNLLGSAAGALLATAAMHVLEPQWIPPGCAALLLAAAAAAPGISARRRWAGCAVVASGVALLMVLVPPRVRIDPFKYLAHLRRLAAQQDATLLAEEHGPRAALAVYPSPLLHDVPFWGGAAAPPPMAALVADGHFAGAILAIAQPEQGAPLAAGLPALPYALLAPDPGVLLLGEQTGVEIWRGLASGAEEITFVQPNSDVLDLLEGPLADRGGAILHHRGVHAVLAEPRHFVDHSPHHYDFIQLVGHQSTAAGSGGFGGLAEDHLMTVEGINACLGRLTDGGILAVTRAIQNPPRDNLKIMATVAEALRRRGALRPGEHVAVVRDFLGVCTMVRPRPWTSEEIAQLREVLAQRNLTPAWFTGVNAEELNQPDMLPGPPGAPGDWYHHGAVRLFSESDAGVFIDEWPFDIRPPIDERPFFSDFCRLESLDTLRQQFGELWLTRAELAFLFVLASIVVITPVAAGLIVVPLALSRTVGRSRGKLKVAVYFGAIGLGYLLVELTFLSRMARWLGDPVTAAALTIAGFLCFSGIGSFWVYRWSPGAVSRRLPWMMGLLVLVAAVELLAGGPLGALLGRLGALRPVAALVLIAPIAVLMGLPMPAALARLDRGSPELVPWGWGINGFASVLASPLALALAMTWSYIVAGGLALALYVVPAILIGRLPHGKAHVETGSRA